MWHFFIFHFLILRSNQWLTQGLLFQCSNKSLKLNFNRFLDFIANRKYIFLQCAEVKSLWQFRLMFWWLHFDIYLSISFTAFVCYSPSPSSICKYPLPPRDWLCFDSLGWSNVLANFFEFCSGITVFPLIPFELKSLWTISAEYFYKQIFSILVLDLGTIQ